MAKAKGFTIVELLLVVAIIITLALIAIPNYTRSKGRSMQKEGIVNLKLIAAAERIYRMDVGDYIDCNCTSASNCSNATGCNTLLRLMLNNQNWSYGVTTSGSAGSKSATVSASLLSGGCSYTLNSADFNSKDFSSSSGCN